jgi:hypothetical protein
MQSLNADGVVVDCWWGIVEGWSPQKYVWSGYRGLFNIVREFKLKLQVPLPDSFEPFSWFFFFFRLSVCVFST